MSRTGLCIMLLLLWGMVLPPMGRSGSLYRCDAGDGTQIYTDSPAQLNRCEPVSFQQPHNVANPASISATGGAGSTSAPVNQSPVSPSDQAPLQAAAPDPLSLAAPPVPTNACPPGINPLNPLSAPPCLQ